MINRLKEPSWVVSRKYFKALDKSNENRLIVHVPGMLMDGHRSLLPEDGSEVDPNGLLGFWRQFGQVQTFILGPSAKA